MQVWKLLGLTSQRVIRRLMERVLITYIWLSNKDQRRSVPSLKIVHDRAIDGDNQKVACSYPKLPMTVRVGSPLFIGGGLKCEITETHDVS